MLCYVFEYKRVISSRQDRWSEREIWVLTCICMVYILLHHLFRLLLKVFLASLNLEQLFKNFCLCLPSIPSTFTLVPTWGWPQTSLTKSNLLPRALGDRKHTPPPLSFRLELLTYLSNKCTKDDHIVTYLGLRKMAQLHWTLIMCHTFTLPSKQSMQEV